jgi:hypothetical protein
MVLQCTVMTCIQSDATWHKQWEYVWFRHENLNCFKKNGTSCLRGNGCDLQMMICAKCFWNWSSGSAKENFKICVFLLLCYYMYLPLEKGNPIHLKSCWNWPAGLGDDFEIFFVYIYSFAIISPERRTLPFIWTWIPSPQDWFVPKLVDWLIILCPAQEYFTCLSIDHLIKICTMIYNNEKTYKWR